MPVYAPALQPQGTKAGVRTMNMLYPVFPAKNLLGIPGGQRAAAIGGYKCVMDQEKMRRYNVQGCVKCSGFNPNPNAYQKPNPKEVANLPDGSPIPVVNFPVTHRDFWKASEDLVDFVRDIWSRGGTVLFFDDFGKDRCVAGFCYLMFRCTGVPAKEWLTTLILTQRQVDKVFYELVHHYERRGAVGFVPKDYRSFILVARIMDHSSSWAIFREAHPNTPHTPGGGLWTPPFTPRGRNARTPNGTDRNAQRREEEAGNVTPRDLQDLAAVADDEMVYYSSANGLLVPLEQGASSSAGVVNPGTA